MSGNMEREKNERLINARKIEEIEEMKRELKAIGLYESDLTYMQMKELHGFIKESQDTSKVASNNKDTHKEQHVNNHLSEAASDANAQQEMALQEGAEASRSPYSYRSNHGSATVHEQKAARYDSPESPPLFEARASTYRRKSTDSDEAIEKPFESVNSAHSTNRILSLRSANVSRECQNAGDRKTPRNTQDKIVQRLERWRLNPLDICINENDVPLKQPKRFSTGERAPFKYCRETHTLEQRDQAIRFISQHLKETADLWSSWHPPANSIFQWGSPIQVGTANGSLDKKPPTESKTEQIKTELAYKDSPERASKRKANSLIASLTRESSVEDEDEDNWTNVTLRKKKKVQSEGRSSSVQRAFNESCEKATSSEITRQGKPIRDNNSDSDFDDENVKSVPVKKTDTRNENAPIDSNTYPRRIVPPIPKARLSLSRSRRGIIASRTSPNVRRNGNKIIEQSKTEKVILSEEDTRKLLEDWNSDEEGNKNDEMKKNAEMRPLPLPKEIRSKLHEKRVSLHETVKETKTTKEEESDDGERRREKKPKLCKQTRKKQEESYKVKNGSKSWEHELMSDDEELFETNQELDVQKSANRSDNAITSTNVSCPICNKLFPHGKIENHAANCEQFETNNEDDDDNDDEDDINVDKYNCNICNNYKTNNGMEYETHVQQCIRSPDIDTTSDSSFYIYKPVINEQNSDIAYLGQFPSIKKDINTNRKRKLYTKEKDILL